MSLKKLQMNAENPIFEEDMTTDEQSEIASLFDMSKTTAETQKPTEILVENIIPSKHNRFDPYTGEKKQAMIDSILENGIITPLTLRKTEMPEIYEIITIKQRLIIQLSSKTKTEMKLKVLPTKTALLHFRAKRTPHIFSVMMTELSARTAI